MFLFRRERVQILRAFPHTFPIKKLLFYFLSLCQPHNFADEKMMHAECMSNTDAL